MGDLFHDGGGVGDDESLESPGLAEEVVHEVGVHGGRNAFELIEGTHVTAGTGKGGLLVGTHVAVEDFLAAQVDRIVIPSCFRSAVQGVVLDAGEDLVFVEDVIISLITMHIGLGHLATEVWILSGSFGNAAPAGIAGDIDHRAEHPVDAGRGGFLRGDAGGSFDQGRIPGCRQGQRNREYGFMAMDDVQTEDQRDAGAGFQGDGLELAVVFHVGSAEDSSQLSLSEEFDIGVLFRDLEGGDETAGRVQVELADFLFKGHAAHQAVDVPVHFGLLPASGQEYEGCEQKGEFSHVVQVDEIDYLKSFWANCVR